ncbi:MAG: Fe(3+) ABC transporter substrate-binding protein [Gammaproteobacteria bacterium]|nr:Fe(3+) ABC transporter substrate-binding protein [Gammaproteobacteria bacterium]
MIQRFSRAAAKLAVLVFAGLGVSAPARSAEQVNLYSARHYDTDFALYDTFTERTGIEVNLIEGGSDALIERIANEGEYTPADILITVDAGRLWRAQERGIFQPVASEVLEQRIPAHLRDPEGHWFGLSKRARVIVHAKDSPLAGGVARYADLANPELRGTVCMRSSSNIYNLSLMSSLTDALGAAAAEEWARGVVANFARPPQSNDTGNLAAVASGECGLTLANTYYVGRWLASSEEADQRMVGRISVVFPNQDDRGTHVNISGAGVTRHAPNRDNAVKFLEYLTSDFAQKIFAEGNNEYPVAGEASGPITALGAFKEDGISAGLLGENQAEAVRIYDRAGWR